MLCRLRLENVEEYADNGHGIVIQDWNDFGYIYVKRGTLL